MSTLQEIANQKREFISKYFPYKMCHFNDFNYAIINNIMYRYRAGHGGNQSYNDVILFADTETSKKDNGTIENHVVAWTISIRAYDMNIATLYGNRPREMVTCINRILEHLQGDDTYIWWHNMAYDWTFMRRFLFESFGHPVKQLNTKSHYPVSIKFDNGLIMRDTLIIAQCKLEKWADDLNAPHKKAVGKWDYAKIRNQDETFNNDELQYIEQDTLAGAECLNLLMNSLGKQLYSMPYTATGIPREMVKKIAKENHGRENFLKQAFTFEQYKKGLNVYHGGYTHGNRHMISVVVTEKDNGLIECYDFSSSYPYTMLLPVFPCSAFQSITDKSLKYILKYMETYCFMFKLILIRPRLKSDDIAMPYLQFSKCIHTINAVADNGRLLCADYVEIYVTEYDAAIIAEQYEFEKEICTEIEVAEKSYLPKWFRDYIFSLYHDKTKIKGSDPVNYSIAKSKLNSLYGLCCQKSIRDEISEDYDSGEYTLMNQMNEDEYNKYVNKIGSVLPYQWGIWVTAYATYSLFRLMKCIDYEAGGIHLYSDTDSCYGTHWNKEKIVAYNNECKENIIKSGYGPVNHNDRDYWLGVAEFDGAYTEFCVLGAKRYAGRAADTGKLKITVAGVPKKGAECLKNDINNFRRGLVFNGSVTGKLTHQYNYVDSIYIDEKGNETGDSINLIECDYLLDAVELHDDWIEEFIAGGYYDEE